MSRFSLFLLAVLLGACAEPQTGPAATPDVPDKTLGNARPVWVERGNWVAEWSAYVPKESSSADGKRVTTMSPAPGALQHVRDADAPSQVDSGIKNAAKIGMVPIPLEGGNLEMRVGEVAERNVVNDQLEAVGTRGDSARVYWTRRRRMVHTENGQPVEVPFSTVFIEGVHPGRTELSLHWPDGVRQTLMVVVRER